LAARDSENLPTSAAALDVDAIARDLARHHRDLPPADLRELAEAIITEVKEAIRKGDQVATIHVNPNGTFEISYIRVGQRKRLTSRLPIGRRSQASPP
jgi:nucleoid DNA-binding protein